MTTLTDINALRLISNFLGDAKDIPLTRVILNGDIVLLYNDQQLSVGDMLVEYVRHDFSATAEVIDFVPAAPTYNGEQWLISVGYTPLRLLTCLDLESKLIAMNLTSPKLQAVRQWIDSITLMAAPDPDALRNDWPSSPYSFAEATGEALQILQGI